MKQNGHGADHLILRGEGTRRSFDIVERRGRSGKKLGGKTCKIVPAKRKIARRKVVKKIYGKTEKAVFVED